MPDLAAVFNLAHPLLTAFVFLFGLCMGSFLNVCIYRIPVGLSVVKPRSRCPGCEKSIAWHDNIPVLSYLALRAKCRHCGMRIAVRYPLVELLTACFFVLVWLKYAPESGARALGLVPMMDAALLPVYWLMVFGLILGTFVDFDHMIIPDRVSLGGIVAGVLLSILVPALHGQSHWLASLKAAAIGAGVGWCTLWLIGVAGKLALRKDAMGFGDVKLMGAIGAFLGWQGVLFTLVASSFVGALVGVGLVVGRRKDLQSRIPYGPYLALAAALWMLWGQAWLDAYIRLLTPAPLL
jgi:leader peptidase (prepilin peptidase)/N-methyltransferase